MPQLTDGLDVQLMAWQGLMKLMTLTAQAYGCPMRIHTQRTNLDKWCPRLCGAICISFGEALEQAGLKRDVWERYNRRCSQGWRHRKMEVFTHVDVCECGLPVGCAWCCCQIKGLDVMEMLAYGSNRRENWTVCACSCRVIQHCSSFKLVVRGGYLKNSAFQSFMWLFYNCMFVIWTQWDFIELYWNNIHLNRLGLRLMRYGPVWNFQRIYLKINK